MSATHAFFHRWFDEVWHKGNIDIIDELMLPEGKCYDFPRPGDVISRDEFAAQARAFQQTFSDIQFTLDDVIVEGDKGCARWSLTMTHAGDGLGFAATGEPVAMSGISFCHFRDGKILGGWNALDLTAVVMQLRSVATARGLA